MEDVNWWDAKPWRKPSTEARGGFLLSRMAPCLGHTREAALERRAGRSVRLAADTAAGRSDSLSPG